jgi:NADH:ubiquinone oxidoreductase subunit H
VLDAALLWSACAVAVICATATVAATAESLNLGNVVLAQEYTGLFLVRRPIAALLFVAGASLAAQPSALDAMLGAPSAKRALALTIFGIAVAALGATLFAAGYSGPRWPAYAWLGVKTLAVFAVLALARIALARLNAGTRLRLAWGCAALGLVQLSVSLAMAMR